MNRKQTVFRRVWWLALAGPFLQAALTATIFSTITMILFPPWGWPWSFIVNALALCWLSGHCLIWHSTSCTIDSANKRLVYCQGIVNLHREYVPLTPFSVIQIRRSPWGRLFNFGEVELPVSKESIVLSQIGWFDAFEKAVSSHGQELLPERQPFLLRVAQVFLIGLYTLLVALYRLLGYMADVLGRGFRRVSPVVERMLPSILEMVRMRVAVGQPVQTTPIIIGKQLGASSVKTASNLKVLRSDFIDFLTCYVLDGHEVLPMDEMLANFPAARLYLDLLSDNHIVFPIRTNSHVDWRVLPHIQSIDDVLQWIPPEVLAAEIHDAPQVAKIRPIHPAKKPPTRPDQALAA